MATILQRVAKIRGRDLPVLILGETGTGKEWLARALHHASPRRDGPFVAVNCAALPDSLIEAELFGYEDGAFTGARRRGSAGRIVQADGGTLFLDEIGDMPLAQQVRLMRVLQERAVVPLGGGRAQPVDVRVVCATHRDLRAMMARQDFREDLYYRINGLSVTLPPLAQRGDLEELVRRMLARLARTDALPERVSPPCWPPSRAAAGRATSGRWPTCCAPPACWPTTRPRSTWNTCPRISGSTARGRPASRGPRSPRRRRQAPSPSTPRPRSTRTRPR